MLKYINILSLAILLSATIYGQEKKQVKWHLNYNEVTELAKKENKLVLILFHGSNWCPPCMRMQKEVFAAVSPGYNYKWQGRSSVSGKGI